MKTVEQVLAKLDKSPAGHNWALCNFQRQDPTTRALVNLAMGFPTISYQWAMKVITWKFSDTRTDEQCVSLLQAICPALQLDHNLGLLLAFLEYATKREFAGVPVLPEFRGSFQAGPTVRIPITPTAILRGNGKLTPLFVIPWANSRLDFFQRRLLTALYEDAVYSLTDFLNSDGEFLIFPRNGYGCRAVDRATHKTYSVLSVSQIQDQIRRYVEGRELAKPLIIEKFARRAEARAARSRDRATQTSTKERSR